MINLIAHAAAYHYAEYIAIAALVLVAFLVPKFKEDK